MRGLNLLLLDDDNYDVEQFQPLIDAGHRVVVCSDALDEAEIKELGKIDLCIEMNSFYENGRNEELPWSSVWSSEIVADVERITGHKCPFVLMHDIVGILEEHFGKGNPMMILPIIVEFIHLCNKSM